MRWLVAMTFYVGLMSAAAATSITPAPQEPPAYFVLFDAASTEITPEATLVLGQVLVDYQALKPSVVYVNGYFYDPSVAEGEAEHRSEQMAEAVRDYIVSKGVPSNVIVLDWHVMDRPIVLADDSLAEGLNRSVDILFDGAKNVLRP